MNWYHSIIRRLFKSSFREDELNNELSELQRHFIRLRSTVYANKDAIINARTKKQRQELYDLLYRSSSPDIIFSAEIAVASIKSSKIILR